jgi:hypothetical protein
MPYQLLSTFSNEIKTTQSEIVDVSKKFSSEDQKAAYYLIAERKADSLTNAMRIIANNRKKESHKDDEDPEPEIETQPKLPGRNEHGALIALPEKVTMRMVKIKPEHMFQNEDDENAWLLCDINVDGIKLGCSVYYEDVNGNFIFELPNVENLIIDFNEVFQTMTPIVSYRPVENEYLAFTRTFPIEEWNDFVESRFPDLMIDKEPEDPKELDIPANQKPVPEAESSKESDDTVEEDNENNIDTNFTSTLDINNEKKDLKTERIERYLNNDPFAKQIVNIIRQNPNIEVHQITIMLNMPVPDTGTLGSRILAESNNEAEVNKICNSLVALGFLESNMTEEEIIDEDRNLKYTEKHTTYKIKE